jgi:hypothetical protein
MSLILYIYTLARIDESLSQRPDPVMYVSGLIGIISSPKRNEISCILSLSLSYNNHMVWASDQDHECAEMKARPIAC